MKTLFIYPESYLNVGIPGGISIMSAILKKHGHEVDLFDTSFIKTSESNKDRLDQYSSEKWSKKDQKRFEKETLDKQISMSYKTSKSIDPKEKRMK